MAIPFIKMHGLGNDFIVVDDLGKPQALCQPITAEVARRMCDRHFGVGADQILWLKSPRGQERVDARMEILNADGSVAEMCGNGIRAAALYLERHGKDVRKPAYAIETLGGVKHVEMRADGLMAVDMGIPNLGGEQGEEIVVAGENRRFFEIDMGNPHAVVFVDAAGTPGGALERLEVERLGAAIERHPRFPNRTNVEFVEVLDEHTIQVRVWERGAGITLACGTGACASAVAAIATGKARGRVEVRLPGGSLWIRWDAGGPVIMEGPAEEVYRGEFLL